MPVSNTSDTVVSFIIQCINSIQQWKPQLTVYKLSATKHCTTRHNISNATWQSWRPKSCNFRIDSCKFPIEKIWVLKMSIFHILPLNSTGNEDCQPHVLYLCKKFFQQNDSFLTSKNSREEQLPFHDATACCIWQNICTNAVTIRVVTISVSISIGMLVSASRGQHCSAGDLTATAQQRTTSSH